MIENSTPIKKIRYTHYITYNSIKYIRSEVQSLNHFKMGGELKDSHVISWHVEEEDINPVIEYYTNDRGWIKHGELGVSNTPPELEEIFKKTIGKDLFYFESEKQ